ncbi:MAG: hypothetical protein JXQ30_15665, partial [Spirochaetes bacterium]|nr:hypothetical protein [Spirochaetota bacterium]
MRKKWLVLLVCVLTLAFVMSMGIAMASSKEKGGSAEKKGAVEAKQFKVAFVPGMVHTFYNSIEWGLEYVADALGFEVVTQIPDTWDAALQTQIIDSLLARG